MDDGQFLRGMTEIAQNLPNLKEFSLDLFEYLDCYFFCLKRFSFSCPGITEVGVKDFDALLLEHFDHLQQLALNFGKYSFTSIVKQIIFIKETSRSPSKRLFS